MPSALCTQHLGVTPLPLCHIDKDVTPSRCLQSTLCTAAASCSPPAAQVLLHTKHMQGGLVPHNTAHNTVWCTKTTRLLSVPLDLSFSSPCLYLFNVSAHDTAI